MVKKIRKLDDETKNISMKSSKHSHRCNVIGRFRCRSNMIIEYARFSKWWSQSIASQSYKSIVVNFLYFNTAAVELNSNSRITETANIFNEKLFPSSWPDNESYILTSIHVLRACVCTYVSIRFMNNSALKLLFR